jgi:hypothetical protein
MTRANMRLLNLFMRISRFHSPQATIDEGYAMPFSAIPRDAEAACPLVSAAETFATEA